MQSKGLAHKCIRKGDVIKRVHNDEALKLVTHDGWQYVPRHVWKKEVRDK